ncbi:hypothetical protein [Nannocystis radixulma]|uniref:Uncharacterized protein n=1 Tax=Nannocystis radixulma TaxID=2995305 RepID=A0ABT5B964_9BACT|nr:hypothetical protein [Nannocystis radixulma]MDC0670670.1 hypothetical protein [Nannocystis radixulma]
MSEAAASGESRASSSGGAESEASAARSGSASAEMGEIAAAGESRSWEGRAVVSPAEVAAWCEARGAGESTSETSFDASAMSSRAPSEGEDASRASRASRASESSEVAADPASEGAGETAESKGSSAGLELSVRDGRSEAWTLVRESSGGVADSVLAESEMALAEPATRTRVSESSWVAVEPALEGAGEIGASEISLAVREGRSRVARARESSEVAVEPALEGAGEIGESEMSLAGSSEASRASRA